MALVHGTRSAYRRGGCRCADAIEAVRRNWARRSPQGTLLRAPKSRDPHIDEIAVARACLGDPVVLTVPERGAAVERLTRQGMPARLIAERLGMTARNVHRYRTGKVKYACAQPVDRSPLPVDNCPNWTVAA